MLDILPLNFEPRKEEGKRWVKPHTSLDIIFERLFCCDQVCNCFANFLGVLSTVGSDPLRDLVRVAVEFAGGAGVNVFEGLAHFVDRGVRVGIRRGYWES